MNNPITPEQALEIAKELKFRPVMQNQPDYDRTIFVADEEELAVFANAVIAEYLGEPVRWLVTDGKTEAQLSITKSKDVADMYLEHHPDNVVTPLYARKE